MALASSAMPVDSLARMTRYYIERGRISKGLEQVQQYIASQGPTPTLYELLAQLHLAQEALAEAAEASEKALAMDPNRHVALVCLGQAQAGQRRFEEAATSYARSIELNPLHMPSYFALADLYTKQGKFDRSVEVYRQALKVDPDSPLVQASMAWVLAETGQELDLALTLAQQAKQQLPEEAGVSDALAWAYHKKGMNELAIPLLEECIAKEPANAIFQYHLGMVYLRSGKGEEGRTLLQAALENGLAELYGGYVRQTLALEVSSQQ